MATCVHKTSAELNGRTVINSLYSNETDEIALMKC